MNFCELWVSVYFVDEGIYTINRNFRLFGSSKFKNRGKSPLMYYNSDKKTCKKFDEVDRETFMETMLSYSYKKMVNLILLTVKAPLVFGRRMSIRDTNKRSTANEDVNVRFRKVRRRNEISQINLTDISLKIRNFFNTKVLPCWPRTTKSSKISAVKERGRLYKTIIICLSGVKYCKNVQREHRSNNIYFCVSVNKGCFYQKCHSKGCERYKSQEIPLVLN